MSEMTVDLLSRELSCCLSEDLTVMLDLIDNLIKNVDYTDILIGEYIDHKETEDYDNFLRKIFKGRDKFVAIDTREMLSIALRIINSNPEFKAIFDTTVNDIRSLTLELIKIQDSEFSVELKVEVSPFFRSLYFYRIYGSTILKVIDHLVSLGKGVVNG